MLRDAKAQHAEGVWQRNQLNRAKGSRGNCPLRSPEAAPLVGLGATPQPFHGRPVMPNALNPAALVAGSAASLRSNFARPQTRPQAALSTYSTLSRQMGATDQHREKSFSLAAGLFRYLRARLRTRKVTGRDASLPAPLLTVPFELSARKTVGALPQTPAGTLSLHPARGNCPLTPFRD